MVSTIPSGDASPTRILIVNFQEEPASEPSVQKILEGGHTCRNFIVYSCEKLLGQAIHTQYATEGHDLWIAC